MLEHRKVWLDSGKDIPPGFHVHHKNHDKQDNRLENLEVLSNSSHQKEHQYEGKVGKNQYGKFIVKCVEHRTSTKRANKLIPRECNGCKDLFTGKRSDAGYCSERCRIKYWKRKKALLLV